MVKVRFLAVKLSLTPVIAVSKLLALACVKPSMAVLFSPLPLLGPCCVSMINGKEGGRVFFFFLGGGGLTFFPTLFTYMT